MNGKHSFLLPIFQFFYNECNLKPYQDSPHFMENISRIHDLVFSGKGGTMQINNNLQQLFLLTYHYYFSNNSQIVKVNP